MCPDAPMLPLEVRPAMAYRYRLRHLVMAGWKPMKPMLVVNYCGHGQEFIPWPEADGYWLVMPVVGEAA